MKSPTIFFLVATLASVSVQALPARVSPAAIQPADIKSPSVSQMAKRDEYDGIPEVIPPNPPEDEDGHPYGTTAAPSPTSAPVEPSPTSEIISSVSESVPAGIPSAGIDVILQAAAQAATTAATSHALNALDVLTPALYAATHT